MLEELLEKNRKFSPVYRKEKLSNHLSMSLIALHELGANSQQLQDFFDTYHKKLECLPAMTVSKELSLKTWMNHLGQSAYYGSYFLFFKEALEKDSMENTLKYFLPKLIKGISSQAFHCIIRLAYAALIKNSEEIAAALAYFSSEYVELGSIKSNHEFKLSAKEILQDITNKKYFSNQRIPGDTIVDRLKKVVVTTEFLSINKNLSVMTTSLGECANLAIHLYAETKDFTVLHMVTAAHALNILTPYFLNLKAPIKYYWQAVCAMYISIGSPIFPAKNDLKDLFMTDLTWEDIISQAILSNDDHTIKFIYSCYEEEKIYHNPIYRYAAMIKLK